jgi:hypothetical protein
MCNANTFSMFPKFKEAADALNEGDKKEFYFVICEYGFTGVEPKIESYVVNALFQALKSDIDNSVQARTQNKGGRPQKSKTAGKTPVSENEKPQETPVSQNAKPSETPSYKDKLSKDKLSYSKEKEGKDKQAHTKKFVPPSPAEVENYANEWILSNPNHEGVFSASDAEQFVNFYASNGWKVGRNQMKDWKASVRTWYLRNERDRKPKGVIDNDIAAQFAEYD